MPPRSDPVEHDPSGDQDESPERKPARSETQSDPHLLIVPYPVGSGHSAGTDLRATPRRLQCLRLRSPRPPGGRSQSVISAAGSEPNPPTAPADLQGSSTLEAPREAGLGPV